MHHSCSQILFSAQTNYDVSSRGQNKPKIILGLGQIKHICFRNIFGQCYTFHADTL